MSKILVTGGTGFIARQIIATLLAHGHEIITTARDKSLLNQVFPNVDVIVSNFLKDTDPMIWIERLKNIDIVINCVGILQHCASKETWQIHYHTPKALFDACVQTGVKKVIQISALGVNKNKSAYSASKLTADEYLQQLNIDSTIIRPSLVFGSGSYGGSSLFRGLASLPFVIPLPGRAQQKLQPIHIDDLAKIVEQSLIAPGKIIIPAVGKDQVSLRAILNLMREWLGFKKAINIPIPLFLIKLTAIFGNYFRNTPINSTSVAMMQIDNVAEPEEIKELQQYITFQPRGFQQALFSQPSQVQDRWHARLYFLKPLARYSIAFVWIWTAVVSIFFYPKQDSYTLLASMGISTMWQPWLLYGGGIIDGLLGISLLANYRVKLIANLQIALIVFYSALITMWLPSLWLHPFSPIAKNLPLIILTLVVIALESDNYFNFSGYRAGVRQMTLYESIKILHIISAAVLFGTGIGTALYMLYANVLQDTEIIVLATKRVVTADWLFTGISGFLQPVTGISMLYIKEYSLIAPWTIAVLIFYLIAAICWFVVVYLQIRCRDLATIALKTNSELPKLYYTYFRSWVILGFPAFVSLIIVFYLMANSPVM